MYNSWNGEMIKQARCLFNVCRTIMMSFESVSNERGEVKAENRARKIGRMDSLMDIHDSRE